MVEKLFVECRGLESRAWIRETSLFWACSGRFFAFGVWNPCLAGVRTIWFVLVCFSGSRVENGRVLVRLVVGVAAFSGLYSVLYRETLFGVAFWLVL